MMLIESILSKPTVKNSGAAFDALTETPRVTFQYLERAIFCIFEHITVISNLFSKL
jgi:hypothetical protein